MSEQVKQILLESYDFQRRKKFSIEYSWKAVFRIIPSSPDLPDLLFIAVSDNYIKPKGLHVDVIHEVLDVKEVTSIVYSRFKEFSAESKEVRDISKFFVVDD